MDEQSWKNKDTLMEFQQYKTSMIKNDESWINVQIDHELTVKNQPSDWPF